MSETLAEKTCTPCRGGILSVSQFPGSTRLCSGSTEGHHPDISFGWGYVTVSLSTKKIKGLHENDFIMASKIDRVLDRSGRSLDR
jgi:hypothetical protein